MNLITDPNERSAYQQAFIDLHDTFSRQIVIWKTPSETVVSTDPNYNGFYGGDTQPNILLTPQSGVFNARIKYMSVQETLEQIDSVARHDAQTINVNIGGVRIRVSGDALDMLNDCERITFDGDAHTIFQGKRSHGLFGTDFFDFILQRIP